MVPIGSGFRQPANGLLAAWVGWGAGCFAGARCAAYGLLPLRPSETDVSSVSLLCLAGEGTLLLWVGLFQAALLFCWVETQPTFLYFLISDNKLPYLPIDNLALPICSILIYIRLFQDKY